MDQKTIDAVVDIPGYLGYDKFGDGNENTFISYWKDLESIDIWRKNFLHIEAKKHGKQWYKKMRVQTVQIHDDINFWSWIKKYSRSIISIFIFEFCLTTISCLTYHFRIIKMISCVWWCLRKANCGACSWSRQSPARILKIFENSFNITGRLAMGRNLNIRVALGSFSMRLMKNSPQASSIPVLLWFKMSCLKESANKSRLSSSRSKSISQTKKSEWHVFPL